MTATFLTITGTFAIILTIAGWVADHHGEWLDRIPYLTDGED